MGDKISISLFPYHLNIIPYTVSYEIFAQIDEIIENEIYPK